MQRTSKIIFAIATVIIGLLPVAVSADTFLFTKNLGRGISGNEVQRLQEFLKTMPEVYPEGLVTGYFGVSTERAVKKLQMKYGIESMGSVGPKTRMKLNALFSSATPPQNSKMQSPTPSLDLSSDCLTPLATGCKKTPQQITISQLDSSDEPPLLLKGIGINLDYYNANTGKAGDFLFTKQKLQFDRLFMGYGFFIPSSSASPDKYNPQPTFVVPLGTPVRSLVDGVVANIPTLWSNDYSIQVTADGRMQKWVYETEHVINPTVKVGDKVVAGQIVGEVSDFNHGAPDGFGTVEIGILKGGKTAQHVCPFNYLDPSIKKEVLAKITALYASWENFRGDTTLYEETTGVPGCLTLNAING